MKFILKFIEGEGGHFPTQSTLEFKPKILHTEMYIKLAVKKGQFWKIIKWH